MAIFPATGNTPVASFIPEVWSALLMVPLHENLVLASTICTNRDYEGEINGPGDRVHANSLVRPTVKDYSRNADILPDLLDTDDQVITIDHGKFFAFAVDDLDRVQVAGGGELILKATQESTIALTKAADSYVAGKMIAETLAANKVTLAANYDVFTTLVDYGQVLDEADVPSGQRFAVVTPAVKAKVLKHDKFIASAYGSAAPIQNGIIGSIAGFTVAVTNNLPGTTQMVVGHPVATTYGDQLSKLEAIRHPSRFAHVVRGLHCAGAKVVRPECLIIASNA